MAAPRGPQGRPTANEAIVDVEPTRPTIPNSRILPWLINSQPVVDVNVWCRPANPSQANMGAASAHLPPSSSATVASEYITAHSTPGCTASIRRLTLLV